MNHRPHTQWCVFCWQHRIPCIIWDGVLSLSMALTPDEQPGKEKRGYVPILEKIVILILDNFSLHMA